MRLLQFLIVAIFAPTVCTAQVAVGGPARDSVSIDLAVALAKAGGFAAEPQIHSRVLADWLGRDIPLPQSAVILGSAVSGSSLIGVIRSPDAPEAVLQAFSRQLPPLGWAPPPRQTPPAMFQWATAPARVDSVPRSDLTLCRDQRMLIITASPSLGGPTTVILRGWAATGFTLCRPARPNPGPVPSPILFNPVTATDGSNLGSGQCMRAWAGEPVGGGGGQSAMLVTPMSASELLEHYARQVQDSGWTVPRGAGTTVTRTWTRADTGGRSKTLTLTVTTMFSDSTCHRIQLDIKAQRPR